MPKTRIFLVAAFLVAVWAMFRILIDIAQAQIALQGCALDAFM